MVADKMVYGQHGIRQNGMDKTVLIKSSINLSILLPLTVWFFSLIQFPF